MNFLLASIGVANDFAASWTTLIGWQGSSSCHRTVGNLAPQLWSKLTCTVEDILRARLKTHGVTEYRFHMENGNVSFDMITTLVPHPFPLANAVGNNWTIYDVSACDRSPICQLNLCSGRWRSITGRGFICTDFMVSQPTAAVVLGLFLRSSGCDHFLGPNQLL